MFDFRLSFRKTKIQSFIVLLKEKSVSNIKKLVSVQI